MTALLRAEGRKVLTTRSTLVVAGFALAYPVLALLPAIFSSRKPEVEGDATFEALRSGSGVLTLAALLLGVLAVAGEYRHGTIVPTLLAAPRRSRLLAGKLGSQAGFAAVLALAAGAVALIAGPSYLASRDIPVDVLSPDAAATLGALAVVVALYAAIGVSIGALVRNQTAAVAGALTWVFVVENAIPVVFRNPGLKHWLPGGAAERLLHIVDPGPGMASAWVALALFAGLAVVLAGAAVVALRAADVS